MNAHQHHHSPSLPIECLAILFLAVSLVPRASAQTAPTTPALGLQFSAGLLTLSLTGETGAVYSVECASDLSSPNPWAIRTLLRGESVWIDPSGVSTNQRLYRAVSVTPPSDTNLVFIESGTFTMGSPQNEEDRAAEESPQTVVMISSGFWMGKYPVTQGEYQNAIGFNPSFFTPDNLYSLDLTRPVERVTWDDATNYCAVRTQMDLAAGRIPTNCAYRLPTEAEYEYAYRAGTATRFPYGDDLDYVSLTNYQWYAANSGGMTHPVGLKLPNPWGLYDMAGNVGNWCQDWHYKLPGGSVVDPQGPAEGVENQSGPGSPPFHVVRVNAWNGSYWGCRSAFRSFFDSDEDSSTGFRVVLAPAR